MYCFFFKILRKSSTVQTSFSGGHANGAKLHAIEEIQDDPNIDSELQTMGIGMEMHGGRHGHARHNAGHHGTDIQH